MIYILCCSLIAGTYDHEEALLYCMSVSDTHISGGMYDNADDGKYGNIS